MNKIRVWLTGLGHEILWDIAILLIILLVLLFILLLYEALA